MERLTTILEMGWLQFLACMMKMILHHAVKSALEMCAEIDDMKPYLKTMYGQDFNIGVGIHWGEAVVGDIGAGKSKRLTAIGDAMNFASRVESANKQFQSRVLISRGDT